MKVMTKICSFLLVLGILLNINAMPLTYSAENDISAQDQIIIEKLTVLGVWGDYTISDTVSRGEFAAALARLIGFLDTSAMGTEQAFQDVPSTHPYSGQIEALYQMRLINKGEDGNFYPDSPITYAQAVKMLVLALGYEPYAEEKGGYPIGYMMTARMNEIIPTELKQDMNDTLTYQDVAQIFDCALTAKLLKTTSYGSKGRNYYIDENATLLSHFHRIQTVTGIISAVGQRNNNISNVEHDLREGEILINDRVFLYDEQKALKLLGYHVTAYYKILDNGKDNQMLYAQSLPINKVLELDMDAIDDCIGRTIYYTNGLRQYKLILPDKIKVIKNGSIAKFSAQDFKNADTVILIDNGSTSSYSLAIIEASDIITVSSVDKFNGIIYDKYVRTVKNEKDLEDESLDMNDSIKTEPRMITLESFDSSYTVELYDRMGSPCDLSQVNEWSVITVLVDGSGSHVKAIVSNWTMKGVIEEIREGAAKTILVNNQEYKIAKNITQNDYIKIDKVSVGDNCTFYLDHKGHIAGYRVQNADAEKYGYLLGASQKDILSEVNFKILTRNNTFEIFKTAKSITIDGKQGFKGEGILQDLIDQSHILPGSDKPLFDVNNKQGNTYYLRTLIRYKTNADKEIILIDTPYRRPRYEDTAFFEAEDMGLSTLTKMKSFCAYQGTVNGRAQYAEAGTYIKEIQTFGSQKNPLIIDRWNGLVFVAPLSNENGEWDDERFYTISNYNYFNDYYSYPEQNSYLEAYDVSKTRVARAIVYYTNNFGTSLTSETHWTIVTGFSEAVNEEGDTVTLMHGYQNYMEIKQEIDSTRFDSTLTKHYRDRTDGHAVASSVKKGDIIRYSTNFKGQLYDYEKIFSFKDEDDPNIVLTGNEVGSSISLDLIADQCKPTLLAWSMENSPNQYHNVYVGGSELDSLYRAVFAELEERENENLVINITERTAGNTSTAFELATALPSNILTIEERDGNIYFYKPNVEELITRTSSEESASKILVRTYEGRTKDIIVIKRSKQ